MRYIDEVVWGSITPKWIGCYESELHEVLQTIVNDDFDTVIDVGCAEGYYAVGLAMRIPGVKVLAFDIDPLSRRQVRRLADLNGVTDNVEVHTYCSHSDLNRLSNGKTLIVCDIEGAEVTLLDPIKSMSLRTSDILVELHEARDATNEVEDTIRGRFNRTHRIDRICCQSRDSWLDDNAEQFADLQDRELFSRAIDEHRATGRTWFWMSANAC